MLSSELKRSCQINIYFEPTSSTLLEREREREFMLWHFCHSHILCECHEISFHLNLCHTHNDSDHSNKPFTHALKEPVTRKGGLGHVEEKKKKKLKRPHTHKLRVSGEREQIGDGDRLRDKHTAHNDTGNWPWTERHDHARRGRKDGRKRERNRCKRKGQKSN